MIRLLNILTDTNIGGAGRLLVNYLRNFDRSVFELAVVLPENSQLKPCIEEVNVPVIEIRNGKDKSMDFAAMREVQNIIRDWKPDIVHTHSAFYGKLAAYLCGVKSRFYTRHSAFPPSRKLTTFPGKQINGFVNNTLATDIVAVAQAAADNMTDTGVDPKKITVIINGVDEMRRTSDEEREHLRRTLNIPDGAFVCGISARLEPYKGHSYLLETMKTVLKSHPNTVLLVLGGGSCDGELKQQATALGIRGNVRFTGFVDDVAPYYNIMDLNLNCSWGTETSCLALSEGMSLYVPAVATTYGGNPYMITEGVNGLLVPEKDSPAMAEAILRIMDDPAFRQKLSDGARAMYEQKFTAAAMTRQLENLYKTSVARWKKP